MEQITSHIELLQKSRQALIEFRRAPQQAYSTATLILSDQQKKTLSNLLKDYDNKIAYLQALTQQASYPSEAAHYIEQPFKIELHASQAF